MILWQNIGKGLVPVTARLVLTLVICSIIACSAGGEATVTQAYRNQALGDGVFVVASLEPERPEADKNGNRKQAWFEKRAALKIAGFLPEIIRAQTRIDSVKVDSLAARPEWQEIIVEENRLGTTVVLAPAAGTRLQFVESSPEYVLLFNDLQIEYRKSNASAISSNSQVLVNQTEPALTIKGDFVLWDNRRGALISYGSTKVKEEIDLYEQLVEADFIWRTLAASLAEDVFLYSPFAPGTTDSESPR